MYSVVPDDDDFYGSGMELEPESGRQGCEVSSMNRWFVDWLIVFVLCSGYALLVVIKVKWKEEGT